MQGVKHCFWGLAVFWAATVPAVSQDRPSTQPSGRAISRQHLADYDAEVRLPNGHVDTDTMVKRLKELGVNTYYWLIWHKATDWDDLKVFLPKASQAGIDVWVYLVPPTESRPQYSEPFRMDYARWAEEIARLSLQHSNLKAWVIDDFYDNHKFFTPTYLREIRARANAVNPRLAFLPLLYFREIRPKFVEDYGDLIDGVVVAYLQDREEIERTWAVLNDAAPPPTSELIYPWDKPSQVGDYEMASQSVKVLPADNYKLCFLERDDFTGSTAGCHFKQMLVDGHVVWEEDVAGGSNGFQKVTVNVTRQLRGKTRITLAFRMIDKKAVYNFGVHWRVAELRAENLQLADDLSHSEKWQVSRQGAFQSGFGTPAKIAERRFQIPFISMTAANETDFRMRHGDPATPKRVAELLRVSLQAWRDGKCDGVVTYGLYKHQPQSQTFRAVQKVFHEFEVLPSGPIDCPKNLRKPPNRVRQLSCEGTNAHGWSSLRLLYTNRESQTR